MNCYFLNNVLEVFMITLRVCVGSACHLKGSYEVIHIFQNLIDSNNFSARVEIKGSFCLGHCSEGVSVNINNGEVMSVTADRAEEFFKKYILGGRNYENNELLCSEL